jgi:uncharacterized spore protein YtfJ
MLERPALSLSAVTEGEMETATNESDISAKSNGHGAEAIARALGHALETEANTRTVFGDPIKLETKTIIPIATIEIGAGGGGGVGQGFAIEAVKGAIETARRIVPGGRGAGGGGGLAIKVRPIGYLTEEDGHVVFTAIPSH